MLEYKLAETTVLEDELGMELTCLTERFNPAGDGRIFLFIHQLCRFLIVYLHTE
jgi:hypothetical protein